MALIRLSGCSDGSTCPGVAVDTDDPTQLWVVTTAPDPVPAAVAALAGPGEHVGRISRRLLAEALEQPLP